MKVPYLRKSVEKEYPELLKRGPYWEQYVKSKFAWELDVVVE
jgi:hypothetical protein